MRDVCSVICLHSLFDCYFVLTMLCISDMRREMRTLVNHKAHNFSGILPLDGCVVEHTI